MYTNGTHFDSGILSYRNNEKGGFYFLPNS